MEEIRSYIESGVLELYAAGDLLPEERMAVEVMLSKHPELKREMAEIETSLESYARTYSLEPSQQLRSRVIVAIQDIKQDSPVTNPIVQNLSPGNDSFFRYAFAASVALLILSGVALAVMYNRLRESKEQILVLQSSNQQFSNRVNYMEEKLSERDLALGVFRSNEFKMVKLAGTKQAPKASMMVAFNPAKKEVMIDMAAMKMPANDAEHQYQLWAMVDGKPVDLGVFDMKADDAGMKRMKAVEEAEAFAVTLEPRGGSEAPTMDQLMVMGQPASR